MRGNQASLSPKDKIPTMSLAFKHIYLERLNSNQHQKLVFHFFWGGKSLRSESICLGMHKAINMPNLNSIGWYIGVENYGSENRLCNALGKAGR
jgi:hypothetical protein